MFLVRWFVVLGGTVRSAWQDDFGIAASSIAFAAFLALIPLGGLAAGAFGLFADPSVVAARLDTLTVLLPAEARQIVDRALDAGMAGGSDNIEAIVASLAITLLSARRAGASLLYAINTAYRVEHRRSPLRRQVVATLLVLGCASLVLAALFSLSALAFLQSYVPDGGPGAWLVSNLVLFGGLALGAGGALILIYRYAPATDAVAWRDALPGAIAGVVTWLAATLAFRFYVSRIARFDDIYGALSAVVVLMFWLLVSAWVLLLGARLNAEAMRFAADGRTKGKA